MYGCCTFRFCSTGTKFRGSWVTLCVPLGLYLLGSIPVPAELHACMDLGRTNKLPVDLPRTGFRTLFFLVNGASLLRPKCTCSLRVSRDSLNILRHSASRLVKIKNQIQVKCTFKRKQKQTKDNERKRQKWKLNGWIHMRGLRFAPLAQVLRIVRFVSFMSFYVRFVSFSFLQIWTVENNAEIKYPRASEFKSNSNAEEKMVYFESHSWR